MGIDISDIIVAQPKKLDDFKGKVVAIDAFNTLYQFLSIIRQPDGTPLKDSRGRITSHLSGLIYRTTSLLEVGIKPLYVFDGKPHVLKSKTIEERSAIRAKAREEWKEAVEEGDMERARMKAQQSSRLTDEMIESSKALINKLGLPCIQAPGEGEAQASFMVRKGSAWGVASQDFDALLFGSPILVRNLTITGKRKLPRKDIYIDVEPETIELEPNLSQLGITREQLVDLAILVGTDFNDGVRGIGPKKALGLVKTHKTLEKIIEEKKFVIDDYQEVRDIFLKPSVADEYDLSWKEPDVKGVMDLLCGEFEFSRARVESTLEKIRLTQSARKQKTLEEWF